MVRWTTLAQLLLLGSQVWAAAVTPANDALVGMVRREMQSADVPGLAYAMTESGHIKQQGAFGSVLQGDSAAMTLDTPMQIGSLTKSITAVAIVQLAEAKRFALDDRIAQNLGLAQAHPLSQVTIRHLLSHTSGLSTLQGNAFQHDLAMDAGALRRRAEHILAMQPEWPPGTRWAYSNANYVLLGFLLERVTGETFDRYIESQIFTPLGMESSWVIGCDCETEAHSVGIGHRPWFGSRRPSGHPLSGRGSGPQGGVVSTAPDMARFLAMLVNGKDDLVKAEHKRLLWQPASAISPRYGLGWFIDEAEGRIQHAGSSPGFEAFAVLQPTSHRAAVVLINANSGFGFGETLQLRQSVTALALGQRYSGERRPWGRQLAFISLLLLPFALTADALRCARRLWIDGAPSLRGPARSWWPVGLAAVLGWILLWLGPRMLGAYYSTVLVYQPDLALVLAVSVGCAATWAIARSLASLNTAAAKNLSVRPASPA